MLHWIRVTLDAEIEGIETLKGIFLKHGFSHIRIVNVVEHSGKKWFTLETFFPAGDALESHQKALANDLGHLQAFDLCRMGELRYEAVDTLPPEIDHFNIALSDQITITSDQLAVDLEDDARILIRVPHSQSFGSGLHPSTVLAARLLEKSIQPAAEVLDVGTGTGILALIAAQLGALKVDAIDIDEQAVSDATICLEANTRDGKDLPINLYQAGISDVDADYNLVVANLPASILLRERENLARLLRPEGLLILSGMTRLQASAVAEAFETGFLEKIEEISDNDWTAFTFRRLATAETERADQKQKSGRNPAQPGTDH